MIPSKSTPEVAPSLWNITCVALGSELSQTIRVSRPWPMSRLP
jgi:hypothetical protein